MESLPGGGAGRRPRVARPRLHYIDWLRVFLTVNVLVMHSLVTYGELEYDHGMWEGQAQDERLQSDDALAYVYDFFATGGLAYRMFMFFVIAGFFSRQSYGSKGGKRFLLDRTLRLLVPTLVYSCVFPPILNYISDTSASGLMYNRITGMDVEEEWEHDFTEQIAAAVQSTSLTNMTVTTGMPTAPPSPSNIPPVNATATLGGRRLLQANLTEISPDPVSAAVELSPFGPDDPSATTADDEDTEGAEGTTPTDEEEEEEEDDEGGDDESASAGDLPDSGPKPEVPNGTRSDIEGNDANLDKEEDTDEKPDPSALPPRPSLRDEFVYWYTEPFNFNVAAGPQWFVYNLWWFTLAYVAVMELSKLACLQKVWHKISGRTGSKAGTEVASEAANKLPSVDFSDIEAAVEEFSVRSVLLWGGVLIFSLSVLQFCARLAMWTNPDMYSTDAQVLLYAINFEPANFPQYVAGFVGGILAHKYNGFARLPTKVGIWALLVCSISYPVIWASFSVSEDMSAEIYFGKYPMYASYVLYMLAHSFFEMCWGTVFGVGLLVAFREVVNVKPGRIGVVIIGASYAVYIIHPIFITLWGRALEGAVFPTFWINAIYVMYLTILSSWLVGAALRMIPGCNCIL